MPDLVQEFLSERQDLRCAPLLRSLVEQVCRLDPEIEPEPAGFGIRFHFRAVLLCEISVFGELFIARVGQEQAIEYRVRSRDVALEALDRIVREYGELLRIPSVVPAMEPPGTPVPSPPS
jgi:hypothetical protein